MQDTIIIRSIFVFVTAAAVATDAAHWFLAKIQIKTKFNKLCSQ